MTNMGLYNISVNQGESFDLVATITNSAGSAINLSGYSVRGSAKYSYGATGSALINLNPSITNSISGSSVTYGTGGRGANGNVTGGNTAVAGAANTGNGARGGGTASSAQTNGAQGGSGIVIITY